MTAFLKARIPLDNNAAERGMRGVVLGRRNFNGSRSKRGTEVAAVFYSLVESAKLCGLEPKDYVLRSARAAITDGTVRLPHELIRAGRSSPQRVPGIDEPFGDGRLIAFSDRRTNHPPITPGQLAAVALPYHERPWGTARMYYRTRPVYLHRRCIITRETSS